ncbi:hypothetical protein EMIT0180MI3_350072 [Priestia megaterium]
MNDLKMYKNSAFYTSAVKVKYSICGKDMILLICSYLIDNCYTFKSCEKATSLPLPR